MKARVLKRLLNDTGYSVADYGDYIAVGSPMCHNLISVDKDTLKVKYALDAFGDGRKAIRNNELVAIWDKLHELIASGEIKDIIEGCDVLENPLLVYTVNDGRLEETTTDEHGWPNVTINGTMMYDNTHFKTREEAVMRGVESAVYRVESIEDNILAMKVKLEEKKERLALYSEHLNNLRKLQGS